MAENIGFSVTDTIGKAMEVWLYKYKKPGVKASTFERLLISHNLLRCHRLANVRIIDLCTADIQDYINTLVSEGYSMSTIRKGYNLLTGFIRFAMGEGMPIRPSHLNVNLPKQESLKRETRQVVAYDPDEQQRIKDAIESADTPGAHAALLMMETGMRVGEVLALRWSDIIWPKRAVRIHATLVNLTSTKDCFVQDSPKSKASVRTIPLSAAALKMLAKIRRFDDGLIFTAPNRPSSIGYNALRKQIQAVCKDANVHYWGAHAFRHTFATNAFYKGCDIKILSKLLGHASVTITYNTYIHLYGDALEEMRTIVE